MAESFFVFFLWAYNKGLKITHSSMYFNYCYFSVFGIDQWRDRLRLTYYSNEHFVWIKLPFIVEGYACELRVASTISRWTQFGLLCFEYSTKKSTNSQCKVYRKRSVCVFPATFAMLSFKVIDCLALLLLLQVSSLEPRPAPFLGTLINGLLGTPPMYPTYPQSPQPYPPELPMFNLQQPMPLYPNQPMPALFPQNFQQQPYAQQPNPYQQPSPYQQQYPWPRYTMTPPGGQPSPYLSALSPLGAGLFNFADAQGFSIQNILGGIFGSIASIFNGIFGSGLPNRSPWVAL